MKVLVTGASGVVGRALLAARPPNVEVELLLDPETRLLTGFPWYRSDITDKAKTHMAVTCAAPQVVLHMAEVADPARCKADPERAHAVNALGAGHVAGAAAAAGARLVMISTEQVFDGAEGPYTEDDRPNPLTVYGVTKRDGELVAAETTDRLAIVRIGSPFGPRTGDEPVNWLTLMEQAFQTGREVRVPEHRRTSPAFLPELADVLWRIAADSLTGIVHYGASDRLTPLDMARAVAAVRGYDEWLIVPDENPDGELGRFFPLREGGFIVGRIQAIPGTHPLSFGDALLTTQGTIPGGV